MHKGKNNVNLFASRIGLPSPWIVFALPKYFLPSQSGHWAMRCSEFSASTAIALELKILLNSPQANWALLLKIILMRDSTMASIILHHLIKNIPTPDCFIASLDQPFMNRKKATSKCEGFLCGKECNKISEWTSAQAGNVLLYVYFVFFIKWPYVLDPVGQTNYQTVLALTYVLIVTGKVYDVNTALMSALDKSGIKEWGSCLDRRQVWNQKRPPWYEAILHLVYPVLDPIVHMLVVAVQTSATVYQVFIKL